MRFMRFVANFEILFTRDARLRMPITAPLTMLDGLKPPNIDMIVMTTPAKKIKKMQIKTAEVQLKVVKPATAQNKQTSLTVGVTGQTLFVEKTCDTFEEGIDLCVDADV